MSSPTVLDIMRKRKAEGSLPNQRKDPHRLALVVEGGGMRGAISAGMATALHELGYRNVFDVMVGSSAGAMNLLYMLSAQGALGASIYPTELCNSNFISLWRTFNSKHPLMDLEYLLDHIMLEKHPLDVPKILKSAIDFNVIATHAHTGQKVVLSHFRTRHRLRQALRATARIPGVSGGPIRFNKEPLIDGCFAEFIPLASAFENGASHALVLLNLPDEQYHQKPTYLEQRIVGRELKRIGSALAETYPNSHTEQNNQLYLVRAAHERNVKACYLPKDGPLIPTLCQDEELLWQGMFAGFRQICAMLGEPDTPLPALWLQLRDAANDRGKK